MLNKEQCLWLRVALFKTRLMYLTANTCEVATTAKALTGLKKSHLSSTPTVALRWRRYMLPVVTLSASVCLSMMALMTEIILTFHGQFTPSGATLGLVWHILKPATSSKLEQDWVHVLKRVMELVKHLTRRVIWIILPAKAKLQSNMKKSSENSSDSLEALRELPDF